VAKSFEENNCENANIHAHGDVHLVVLAHSQSSVGFDAFVEVKCIFSTTLEVENFSKSSWIETEANGGH
jgi:hypothetical protein